jgi:hypothetical protein
VNPQTTTSAMGGGPRSDRSPRRSGHRIVIAIAVAAGLVAASAGVADAQGKRRRTAQRKEAKEAKPATGAKKSGGPKSTPSKGKKEQRFDFTGFELAGSVRMPQLLYFLDRAEEELERASLERRTFVPEMLKSLDEENL